MYGEGIDDDDYDDKPLNLDYYYNDLVHTVKCNFKIIEKKYRLDENFKFYLLLEINTKCEIPLLDCFKIVKDFPNIDEAQRDKILKSVWEI